MKQPWQLGQPPFALPPVRRQLGLPGLFASCQLEGLQLPVHSILLSRHVMCSRASRDTRPIRKGTSRRVGLRKRVRRGDKKRACVPFSSLGSLYPLQGKQKIKQEGEGMRKACVLYPFPCKGCMLLSFRSLYLLQGKG